VFASLLGVNALGKGEAIGSIPIVGTMPFIRRALLRTWAQGCLSFDLQANQKAAGAGCFGWA